MLGVARSSDICRCQVMIIYRGAALSRPCLPSAGSLQLGQSRNPAAARSSAPAGTPLVSLRTRPNHLQRDIRLRNRVVDLGHTVIQSAVSEDIGLYAAQSSYRVVNFVLGADLERHINDQIPFYAPSLIAFASLPSREFLRGPRFAETAARRRLKLRNPGCLQATDSLIISFG